MEAVLEREAATPKIDWRNVRMYDEDGTQIKNPDTLRAMAEAVELADEWERRIERSGIGEIMRRYYEEDEDIDDTEEEQ